MSEVPVWHQECRSKTPAARNASPEDLNLAAEYAAYFAKTDKLHPAISRAEFS